MILTCISDNCPETGHMVDYRRCSGYRSRPACKHYRGDNGLKFGQICCSHLKAAVADAATQAINREVFRACGVAMHVIGPR